MFRSHFLALVASLALVACGDNASKSENNQTPNNTANQMPNNTTQNASNACANLANTCSTAGTSCEGDTFVTCAPGAATSCLVEARIDCAAGGQVCDSTDGCIDNTATCMDDAACVGASDGDASCDGDSVVTCTRSGNGCLVATVEDCTLAGEICDDTTTATCVASCMDATECVGAADGATLCSADMMASITCSDTDADGCLEATTTACGADFECDAATGTCASSCSDAVRVLSCADAGMTINGDTTNGSDLLDESACGGSSYQGNEVIYVFSDATAADITVTINFDDNLADLDLFAVTGGSCTDTTITCSDESTGTFGDEDVTFASQAGETHYIVVDGYDSDTDVAPFTLTVDCFVPACGDGVISAGESCDDMNTMPGDGCDAACQTETDYLCTGEPSICVEDICGNGLLTPGEACDDGGVAGGDGCDANCQVEANYVCDGAEPTVCTPDVCGDGILSVNEECDDNGVMDGDGCSAVCEAEFGYICNMAGCTMEPAWGTASPGSALVDLSLGMMPVDDIENRLLTVTDYVILDCAATVTTMGDIDIYIYDENGYVDSFAADGDEIFFDLELGPGLYRWEFESYGPDDIDGATVHCDVEPTQLGSFAAGAPLTIATTDDLEAGDSDWYSFTVTDAVSLTGTLAANVAGDLDLTVYAADGTPIFDHGFVGDEVLNLALAPGDYLIEIYSRTFADIAGGYSFSASMFAFAPFDIGSFAPAAAIPVQNGGALGAGVAGFLSITFTADVLLTITLDGWTMGDMALFVYDPAGARIRVMTTGFDTASGRRLPAGTYYISMLAQAAIDAHRLTLSTVAAP